MASERDDITPHSLSKCIDPNGGFSRSLVKLMQIKELVQWRMNHVNASVHSSLRGREALEAIHRQGMSLRVDCFAFGSQ
jgi:hypothetical protein